MDTLLLFMAGMLAPAANKAGRDWLAWLLVGSVLGPLCAALALLMLRSDQEPSCPLAT